MIFPLDDLLHRDLEIAAPHSARPAGGRRSSTRGSGAPDLVELDRPPKSLITLSSLKGFEHGEKVFREWYRAGLNRRYNGGPHCPIRQSTEMTEVGNADQKYEVKESACPAADTVFTSYYLLHYSYLMPVLYRASP